MNRKLLIVLMGTVGLVLITRIAMTGLIHVCVDGPADMVRGSTFNFGRKVVAKGVTSCFWFRADGDDTLGVTTPSGAQHALDYIPHEVVGCARVRLTPDSDPDFEIEWDTFSALRCELDPP